MPHNPQRLQVVQRADTLAVALHGYAFRHRRRFGDISPGLRNQLVRAATSISLNLGEACGYGTVNRAVALLEVAIGSCNEAERILNLCSRLGISDSHSPQLIAEIGNVRAMTYGFRRRLLSPPIPRPPTSDESRESDLG